MHGLRKVAMIFAVAMASGMAIATGADRGLRFNSPGVLDLAEPAQKIEGGNPVPVAALGGAEAAKILATAAVGEDPPALKFSDDEFGCKKPARQCSLDHERKLLDAASATVKRDGKHLLITPVAGAAANFIDWTMPTTKTADGDEETHWYLGRLAGSGYERVEVQFGHDAPGNFLINPQSGKVAFVHNGADLVVPSPDGKLLMTFNALNPPLSIRVAALDANGPRLALQCETPANDDRSRPVFKGWHDAASFDLTIEMGDRDERSPPIAVRTTLAASSWRAAASEPARLARIGFVCRAH
jgi:hypothetical protein